MFPCLAARDPSHLCRSLIANTSRKPWPARMYCSRMAPNSSWPAVSRTAKRGEGATIGTRLPACHPQKPSAPHLLPAALTVQPGRDAIHGADLRVGVFNGGVVVRHEVGLVGWGEDTCYCSVSTGNVALLLAPAFLCPLSGSLSPSQSPFCLSWSSLSFWSKAVSHVVITSWLCGSEQITSPL